MQIKLPNLDTLNKTNNSLHNSIEKSNRSEKRILKQRDGDFIIIDKSQTNKFQKTHGKHDLSDYL